MTSHFIYLSILVASLGTYFCRAFGVFSARNINADSPIFIWIKCVSIAVISAVIARIIMFPSGILNEATTFSRILATIVVLVAYFSFKKNVILAILSSTISFMLFNHFL
ncbi:MAG: AzlD domain-containing protein [Pelagibacteraceae bacterium]|jgi:branched-subunit amino acid transport protein|nr:AzlD domain-containing protein [Pelagibacteraceae bacterium]